MKILVTGGAGYIGSHTVKMLSERGFEVIVFDNLSAGYKENVRNNTLYLGDLRDLQSVKLCFDNYQFKAVIHFAASCFVSESSKKPAEYYRNNIISTYNLLECMKFYGVHNIIFSSTCAVYGTPTTVPLTEILPKEPVSVYGKTKSVCEEMIEDFYEAYKIRYVIFRYFNAAGADPNGEIGEKHIPESHLIPKLMDYLVSDSTPFEIYGNDYNTKDGTCIRDFIHVNDIAKAHISGLEYLLSGNRKCNIFNLGNGSGNSVLDVVKTTQEILGVKKEIKITERRSGDPGLLIGDYGKARQILKWEPEIADLKDIIASAWNWRKSENFLKLKK